MITPWNGKSIAQLLLFAALAGLEGQPRAVLAEEPGQRTKLFTPLDVNRAVGGHPSPDVVLTAAEESSQPDLDSNVPEPSSPGANAAPDLGTDVPEPSSPNANAAPSKASKNPAATAYKGVFYDNDFSYLDNPDNKQFYLGDAFKQMHVGDCWLVDVGGEYRMRGQNEDNLRNINFADFDDDFLLQRTRLFVNARYGDCFRFYGEAIDAVSDGEDHPPRTIEENRFDALNLFADALLYEGDGKWWGRVGRQELLYGEQRLVSPLDWANTRRTFDGAKIFYRSKEWDVDGFWTRPVPFAQHIEHDHNFDNPNLDQEFMGLYSTYKGQEGHVYDFYYLRYADYGVLDFDYNTFGTRGKGKYGDLLYDYEGGYQFGEVLDKRQSAGFATVGLGREWVEKQWKPMLWVYYDWASGNRSPNDDVNGTFNQLFPLGHKYFGFCDLVARQNIRDFNMQFTARPTDKLSVLLWWHLFYLDSARDALYNANGVPIRFDPTGASGTYVGQELDFTAQYVFNPRWDLLVGYSHFFPGTFVKATNPPGVTGEVNFYYTQLSWRF